MKKNLWHGIEQCTIDKFIDQWHSRLKTCMCATGGHFKHMVQINLCRKQITNILREYLQYLNGFHHFELN